MQLSRRKQNNSARRNNDANLGIDLNRFNRLGKGSWVGFQKLGDMSTPMLLVPLVVIVTAGIILDSPILVLGMKGHRIIRTDVVNRNPPIDLTRRG